MDLDYTWLPARAFRRYSDPNATRPIRAIILHSGDGHQAGDLDTLTSGQVSAHWYVNRAGQIWHMVSDSDVAYHCGVVKAGMPDNSNTIGIETEHIDGQQDWPADQVAAIAKLLCAIRQRHGHVDVLGHAHIAPKRKVDPMDFPWSSLKHAVLEHCQTTWNLVPVRV